MNIFTNVLKLVPLILASVQAVETLATNKKGQEKQDAAVDLVRSFLPLIESYVGRDVFDDIAVQASVRSAIDAIVALQKAVDAARAARLTPAIPAA